MAFKVIPKAKESTHVQVKSEMHAFVIFLIPWVFFTKSGFLLDRQPINITTQRFLKD
jgi:hypothetical protein